MATKNFVLTYSTLLEPANSPSMNHASVLIISEELIIRRTTVACL